MARENTVPYQFKQLRDLYRDMKKQGKTKEKYTFSINRVEFEAIFVINKVPFELLVGTIGYDIAFVLEVRPVFQTEMPMDKYYEILSVLQLRGASHNFTVYSFLDRLDRAAPPFCSSHIIEPHEVARYYKSETSEDKKIYFFGWNDHIKDKKQAQNFKKTRERLGDDVADFCQRNNISSRWTDKPKKSKKYFDPPEFH